jgi:hypothetical protein
MITVEIEPGICGLPSRALCNCEDGQNCTIEFTTQCDALKPLEAELKELDAFATAFGKVGETAAYTAIRAHCIHAACPVPLAVTKGVEAAAGLALPRDCTVKLHRS